jgi:hypothetical protein
MSIDEQLRTIRARLGDVPVRCGASSYVVQLDETWWLFVPRGTYVVGQRDEERAWVARHHRDLLPQLDWIPPHERTLTDDLLVRATPILVHEAPSIDLDRERLMDDLDLDDTSDRPEALHVYEDEIELVSRDLGWPSHDVGPRFLSSDEWEIAIRHLGADGPYFHRGKPPSERALRDAEDPHARHGALWGMPHFCREGDLWIRRGGPLLAWPFQDPREWALTIPSLRHGPFDPDTCLLRPCRTVSSLGRTASIRSPSA